MVHKDSTRRGEVLGGLNSQTQATILTYFEPLVASLLGVLVFKDHLNQLSLYGAGLILVSMVLINRPESHGRWLVKTGKK